MNPAQGLKNISNRPVIAEKFNDSSNIPDCRYFLTVLRALVMLCFPVMLRVPVILHSLAAVLLISCQAVAIAAEESYRFGMSTALSGPASQLGNGIHQGFLTAFAQANRNGGVHGRKLYVEALDDRYNPQLTSVNMNRLLADPDILAIVGNLGTPTAVVSLLSISRYKTLFYAPFTGAGLLRERPQNPYVINLRPSYRQEVFAMVDALVDIGGLKPEQIGFFTQRDAYGDSGYTSGIEALKQHGLASELDVFHVRYERNTLAVENALAELLLAESPPKAIINVGVHRTIDKLIQLAYQSDYRPLFLSVSFSSDPLPMESTALPVDIVVTQVVPNPHESELAVVKEYLQNLKHYDSSLQPSFWSLEGYIAARVLITKLEQLQPPITRQALVDSFNQAGTLDIGLGYPFQFGPDRVQATDRVWPILLTHGRYQNFDWQQLKTLLNPVIDQ